MFVNGPVNWSARLLKVAASSCQAETAAGCVAAKQNSFLRILLGHLFDAIHTKLNDGANVLLVDKFKAVEQADRAGGSKKTEHYKRWEYYLCGCQLDCLIKAHFICTAAKWPTATSRIVTRPRFSSCATRSHAPRSRAAPRSATAAAAHRSGVLHRSTTYASASLIARSRRTSCARATKWPTHFFDRTTFLKLRQPDIRRKVPYNATVPSAAK
eukprot:40039-Pleurochrysis_carterae.AAC.1